MRKVQTVNGRAFTVRYAYTLAGRLRQVTYPDGAVVDYVRDAQGRPTEVGVTRSGQMRSVLLHQAGYAPFGPSTGWSWGNGRSLQRSLDQDYRTERVFDGGAGTICVSVNFDVRMEPPGWETMLERSTYAAICRSG